MGMDVYGHSGNYFRRNIWGWHPLADFVEKTFPELARGCPRWHTNDGDGLDGEDARALADAMDAAVASGEAARYVEARDAKLAKLPDETCQRCNGTGVRRDDIGKRDGMDRRVIDGEGHPRRGQRGGCDSCNGVGHKRPSDTWFSLRVDDVREFAAFLRGSDGFRIH